MSRSQRNHSLVSPADGAVVGSQEQVPESGYRWIFRIIRCCARSSQNIIGILTHPVLFQTFRNRVIAYTSFCGVISNITYGIKIINSSYNNSICIIWVRMLHKIFIRKLFASDKVKKGRSALSSSFMVVAFTQSLLPSGHFLHQCALISVLPLYTLLNDMSSLLLWGVFTLRIFIPPSKYIALFRRYRKICKYSCYRCYSICLPLTAVKI